METRTDAGNHIAQPPRLAVLSLVVVCAMLLGTLTAAHQLREIGLSYLQGEQAQRHQRVMEGRAGSPWQYRVLSEYAAEGAIRVLRRLGYTQPRVGAYIAIRLLQNFAIMLLAYAYYRRLGAGWPLGLIGISIAAWAMTHSLWGSDIRMHTYGDVIVYLLAAWAIVSQRYLWGIPIVIIGALNRETSGLVPVMLAVYALMLWGQGRPFKRPLVIAAVAAVVFAGIQLGLRKAFGPQVFLQPDWGGKVGLELLRYNLGTPRVLRNIGLTLGVVPIVCVIAYRWWPLPLKAFFLAIVPIWAVIHLTCAVLGHTSLLLVPMLVVFIPGALAAAAALPNHSAERRAAAL